MSLDVVGFVISRSGRCLPCWNVVYCRGKGYRTWHAETQTFGWPLA